MIRQRAMTGTDRNGQSLDTKTSSANTKGSAPTFCEMVSPLSKFQVHVIGFPLHHYSQWGKEMPLSTPAQDLEITPWHTVTQYNHCFLCTMPIAINKVTFIDILRSILVLCNNIGWQINEYYLL